MSAVLEPIAQRSPPVRQSGAVLWIRTNLFADWKSSVATIAVIALAVIYLPGLAEWAIFRAVTLPDAEMCQRARGIGACWWC